MQSDPLRAMSMSSDFTTWNDKFSLLPRIERFKCIQNSMHHVYYTEISTSMHINILREASMCLEIVISLH